MLSSFPELLYPITFALLCFSKGNVLSKTNNWYIVTKLHNEMYNYHINMLTSLKSKIIKNKKITEEGVNKIKVLSCFSKRNN